MESLVKCNRRKDIYLKERRKCERDMVYIECGSEKLLVELRTVRKVAELPAALPKHCVLRSTKQRYPLCMLCLSGA